MVQLRGSAKLKPPSTPEQLPTEAVPNEKPPTEPDVAESVDLRVHVKDSGMRLFCGLAPNVVTWQSGNASIDLQVKGAMSEPQLSGRALLSKAHVFTPYLKYPLTNLQAHVTSDGNGVKVHTFEARTGRRGQISVRGQLPFHAEGDAGSGGLHVDAT